MGGALDPCEVQILDGVSLSCTKAGTLVLIGWMEQSEQWRQNNSEQFRDVAEASFDRAL